GHGVAIVAFLGRDIEQQHRHPRISDLRGDARAHHARADDADALDGRLAHSAVSSTVATPCPPPIHIVASAYFPPSRLSSEAALPRIRAPDAPSGCPIAIAPPSRFTFASSSPRSCNTASAWLANAS